MKTSPLLSIIVPVYNVEKYIKECLLSIAHQDYTNIEIIVVNDGSTDQSFPIAKELSHEYKNIHVYSKSNGGLSDARNFGLEKAKGDFITFIDSDDALLATDIYSKIMNRFLEDEGMDIIQYDVIHQWNSTEEHKRNYPFKIYTTKEEIAEGYLRENIHVSCCDKVFRAKVFEHVRFPLHQQSEDIAVISQLIKKTNKLQTTDIGFYGYRHREGSISTSTLTITKILGILISYHTYFTYTYSLKSLRPLTIQKYTGLIWEYGSVIRKYHQESLGLFFSAPIFIKVKAWDWFAIIRKIENKKRVKSFISCVLGPKHMIKLQKLVTR